MEDLNTAVGNTDYQSYVWKGVRYNDVVQVLVLATKHANLKFINYVIRKSTV